MAERAVIVVTTEAQDIDVPAELTVATADQFLDGRGFTDPDAHVINLCRDTSYGTKGYYVSLLAEARGQMVLPRVETMASLAEPYSRFRVLQEAGASTIDAQEMTVRRRVLEQTGGPPVALADRPPTSFSTPVIFVEPGNLRLPDAHEVVETFVFLGKCRDARFQQIASAVFREFPAPLLRVQIVHEESTWKISQVATLSPRELTAAQLKELGEALRSYRTNSTTRRSRETTRASLAVLLDPGSHFSPSTPETIDRLERVASRMNVHLARLTLQDLRRLPEYDAVFIRAHTSVTHPAFQFAVRAEALGMPVVDATNSTIRCTNKVFIDELLRREAIATPRAIIVKANTSWEEIASIGLPFVLKLPDGDFSAAVHKVATREDYEHYSRQMFKRSALLLAQEWLPTDFDWRIGVLGGQLLFVCKYYMARGHWQIRSVEKGTERYGKVEAVRRDQAPPEIVEIALRAAAMIGDGFYGVDIKETAHGPVVIEVNDNANLDIGYEAAADGDVIYEDIINYFLRKIEAAASTRETGANSEAHLAE
ncbi:MAG TPA: RimK family protein, partial [Longimicrobiales bacterium]